MSRKVQCNNQPKTFSIVGQLIFQIIDSHFIVSAFLILHKLYGRLQYVIFLTFNAQDCSFKSLRAELLSYNVSNIMDHLLSILNIMPGYQYYSP